MLNKLLSFIRQQDMIAEGDHIICAISGGADSVALLFAMYLLKDKLKIRLSAAHFNHHLRGEESDRDEAFVKEFCDRYDIPLYIGGGEVVAGKKGLEAAARDARYAFLRTLPGKIATAHTADDNAETILLHLVRGTGLKGLGGITPINGNVIRPMLSCTRQDVEEFCAEWCLSYITDSSNKTDDFLRNRLRHHVMPLLQTENPKFSENISAMALRLRQDEDCLSGLAKDGSLDVEDLKNMHPAIRNRMLEQFLKASGVREPEAVHIAAVESLIYSDKPSAKMNLPGGVTIARCYRFLKTEREVQPLEKAELTCPGTVVFGDLRITCQMASEIVNREDTITVCPAGKMYVRSREAGDSIRLSGGTKSLKKLFIDMKIPAAKRSQIPVVADDAGVLGIHSIGVNLDRGATSLPAVQIKFEIL